MTKTTQARNICYAHQLSMAQPAVWAVTHNFFQGPGPTSQGDSGDFGLVDYPPTVWGNLTNGRGHATYDAYAATSPMTWNVTTTHYCCSQWGVGCGS